jgi:predicted nucleic acid-binding protein
VDRLFVDTDIVLDLLQERQPHYPSAAGLFTLADRQKLTLHVSSLSFTNLNYVLRKSMTTAEARKTLSRLKVLVKVLAVDNKIIELALASSFNDFEDAVQHYTATENKINNLITRNLKDYKKASINVMTADEYVQSLK